MEYWLLEVDYLAGTLVTRRISRLKPDGVGRWVSTVDTRRANFLLIVRNPLYADWSLRCDLFVILRHVIAEPIYVVLEDKVVNLACVARITSRDPILDAGALQVHEILLLKLEVSIELINDELLFLANLILIFHAATLSA